jgi:hypothetical protein
MFSRIDAKIRLIRSIELRACRKRHCYWACLAAEHQQMQQRAQVEFVCGDEAGGSLNQLGLG